MWEVFKIICIVWLVGGFLAYVLTQIVLLIPYLFSYNSIRRQNLRLILLNMNINGVIGEVEVPEENCLKNGFKEYLRGSFQYAFICLFISWFQILLIAWDLAKKLIGFITTPESIRSYQWKIKNHPFPRAEDFLDFAEKGGFLTKSEKLKERGILELSRKSEELLKVYAENVFYPENFYEEHEDLLLEEDGVGENKEAMEIEETINKFITEVKRINKEDHDSSVIHPRFWTLPRNVASALRAVKKSSIEKLG